MVERIRKRIDWYPSARARESRYFNMAYTTSSSDSDDSDDSDDDKSDVEATTPKKPQKHC